VYSIVAEVLPDGFEGGIYVLIIGFGPEIPLPPGGVVVDFSTTLAARDAAYRARARSARFSITNTYLSEQRSEHMVKESAIDEWVRTLSGRPPDRDEGDSQYVQAVGEARFMLVGLAVADDTDLAPDDRVAVKSIREQLQTYEIRR
jgi:hypothetical protein